MLVEARQKGRLSGYPLGNGERGPQLVVGQMTDRRAAHPFVPGLTEGVIQADPHEAMVEADGPVRLLRHAGQHAARQVEPARYQVPTRYRRHV